MAKLRFNITMSLDGYVAGPGQSLENPLGEGGHGLHAWAFATRSFRAAHGMDGGETGLDDDRAASWNANIGATIMGRNMFGPIRGPWGDGEWRGWWGDNPNGCGSAQIGPESQPRQHIKRERPQMLCNDRVVSTFTGDTRLLPLTGPRTRPRPPGTCAADMSHPRGRRSRHPARGPEVVRVAGVIEVEVATSVAMLVEVDPQPTARVPHRAHVHELALVERRKRVALSCQARDTFERPPLRLLWELHPVS